MRLVDFWSSFSNVFSLFKCIVSGTLTVFDSLQILVYLENGIDSLNLHIFLQLCIGGQLITFGVLGGCSFLTVIEHVCSTNNA